MNTRVFLKSIILIIGFMVIASSQVQANHVIIDYLAKFGPLCIGPNERDFISVVNTSANFSDDNNQNGNNLCIINLVKVQAFDPETGELLDEREARNIEPGKGVNIPITDTLPGSYFSLLRVHVEVSPIHENGVIGEKNIPLTIRRLLCNRRGGTVFAEDWVPPTPNIIIAHSIGDTVFSDLNRDGVQDTNEPGIEGVTVTLNCGGEPERSAVTDANGNYLFTNIPADINCSVSVDPSNPPPGKITGRCPIVFDITLAPGESFLDADFCFENAPN